MFRSLAVHIEVSGGFSKAALQAGSAGPHCSSQSEISLPWFVKQACRLLFPILQMMDFTSCYLPHENLMMELSVSMIAYER